MRDSIKTLLSLYKYFTFLELRLFNQIAETRLATLGQLSTLQIVNSKLYMYKYARDVNLSMFVDRTVFEWGCLDAVHQSFGCAASAKTCSNLSFKFQMFIPRMSLLALPDSRESNGSTHLSLNESSFVDLTVFGFHFSSSHTVSEVTVEVGGPLSPIREVAPSTKP